MPLSFSASSVRIFAVSALALGIALFGMPFCAVGYAAPAVQTYEDDVLSVQAPPSQERYDSPLAAGTLTLQDVLEAHKNRQPLPTLPKLPEAMAVAPSSTATAPLLKPAAQSSATSLMMSQGMKDVLQKIGDVNIAPITTKNSQPTSATTNPAPPAPLPTALVAPNGLAYQPGQAPKNLATGQVVGSAPVVGAAVTSTSSPSPSACGQVTDKWEKTCGDAGYPANYVGKITGETRTGCADGALHDVWVANSCAPPDGATAQTDKTDGACGIASDNEFDGPPASDLCSQGIASAIQGEGPWTWVCSGVNGGAASICIAQKHRSMSNGICGGANGVAVSVPPSSDLCANGMPTEVKAAKNGWTWSCRGRGKGGVQNCVAPAMKQETIQQDSIVEPVVVTKSTVTSSVGSEKGELCGTAAETLAAQAPDKDLCRAGTASAVNGEGPWSWSCTDNEGTTSSCRTLALNNDNALNGDHAENVSSAPVAAPQKPVQSLLMGHKSTDFTQPASDVATATDLACGLAASQAVLQAPTTELCQGGKASAVRGSGPWRWTCSNASHHKISCETVASIDGACGPANGASLKSAPFAGLCTHGTPSDINGHGPWTWICNGSGGGSNVTCVASVAGEPSSVDGVCGSADGNSFDRAPRDALCAAGTASDVKGRGPWTWSCSGTGGGGVSSCSATKVAAASSSDSSVNGLCGFANGVVTNSRPTDGLCGSGKASSVLGNGPWNWSCDGENGGMSVSCTAPLAPPAPIDGVCGGANGVPALAKPQSGLCDAGILGSVSGKGPWTWTCSGVNGGNPASCMAPVGGNRVSASPVAAMVGSNNDNMPAPVTASSGLVTPHLARDPAVAPADQSALSGSTKSRAAAVKAVQAPAMANISGNDVPDTVPTLPDGTPALVPPKQIIQQTPVLQETDNVSTVRGNRVTLDPTISTILFDRGSGAIAANVLTTLDRLSGVLTANPDVRIALTAYADNGDSTPRDARRLSLIRVLAVKDYLAGKGVAESRIDVHAEGSNTTSGYLDRVDVKVIN